MDERKHSVELKLNREEFERVAAMAEKKGVTKTNLIRELLGLEQITAGRPKLVKSVV